MAGANDDLAAALRAWVKTHSPGPGKVHIEADLVDGLIDRLNVDWRPSPAANAGQSAPADPLADFVPTRAQCSILEALEGKVLKGVNLESESGLEHSQMFQVLKKLQALGIVKRHPSLGYYRVDAPPPELADQEQPPS
jgi:hypothetical protein